MLTVFVDIALVPHEKQKELIRSALADIQTKCDFIPQRVEKTISWQPPLSLPATYCEDIRKEVLAVLNAEEAVAKINAYIQNKQGIANEETTLTEWVQSMKSALPDQNLTVIIVGLNKYFSNQKLASKQRHREAVTGKPAKGKKRTADTTAKISTEAAEEAFVEVQLLTGCVIQQVATDEELVSQIKHYTKAVADKPTKKDRFDNVFSFLEEGTGGLSVNKQGQGLKKVWKHQMMQLKNFGAEMAEALVNTYPSPMLLHEAMTLMDKHLCKLVLANFTECNSDRTNFKEPRQMACKQCSTTAETDTLLADINVRRNAGVISTNRKIGKEHARRIQTFMTSSDPEQVIK